MWNLLYLLACTAGSPTDTDADTDTDVDTDTGDTDDTDVPAGLLDDLLAGTVDPADATHELAWSAGWPVAQGTTYTFVHMDGGAWSLVGDFNDWEPAAMDCGLGFCWIQVEIDGDTAGMKYKFNRNDEFLADPLARSYGYDEFGETAYVRPPTDTWRLDRWPRAGGAGIPDRDLRVYVPAGAGPWNVLYAHDGQNLFDPGAIWGGWRMQDALADHPALVVGLDNTPARFDDYTHVPDDFGSGVTGGNGDAYADFVHTVVRPHIEAEYGTTGVDGQIGSSLGGLIALHIVHRFPGEYDFVASLSGTLGWGRFSNLGDAMETRWLGADPGGVVFLSSGGTAGSDGVCTDPDGDGIPEDDPDATDNYCTNRQMADALAAAGRTWQTDLHHWHEPGAPHNEAAWADLVSLPLELFAALQP